MANAPLVVLGVTGSIAAHRAIDLASLLTKAGANVNVVLTADAQQFVQPLPFRTLSRNPVVTSLYDEEAGWKPTHIRLADEAALLLVAFLASKGITVGLLKSSDCPDGKLAYVIKPESELCNLRTVNANIRLTILRDELLAALEKVEFYGATGCLQDSLDEAKRIARAAIAAVKGGK